jgi:hypothetical protein
MKTLIVWTLLAVIPSASLRVICISELPQADESSVHAATVADCEMICSKAAHGRPRTKCILVDDPSCAFLLDWPAAIMPAVMALTVVRTVQPIDPGVRTSYSFFSLGRAGPPPKAC